MRIARRWIAAAALLAGAGGAWLVQASRDRSPRLALREVASWTLPDSFELKGAFVSPADNTVLWAVNQPYLLVEHGGRRGEVRSASLAAPVGAALLEGDTLLEVVDAGRRSVLRLALSGQVRSETPLDLPWRVDNAVRSGSAWVLAGRDGGANGRVVALAASGGRTHLLTLPAKRYEDTPLALQLSGAGETMFAAVESDPRLVTRLSASRSGSGRLVERGEFAVPELPAKAEEGGEPPLWISLGIHPLDRGFIRTLSDLRSDRRVLVTYDGGGKLLRNSMVAVPMAVVATVPRRRELLAARRTDRLELVTYRWRWVGGNFNER